MGTLKKIAVSVSIIVIAGLIMLYATSAYNEFAEVGYQLKGLASYYRSKTPLSITLYEENSGKVGAVPISKIYVVNGTITKISINGVPQVQVSDFCWYNETMAIIGNLTIPRERSLSPWATIYVAPDEGVLLFSAEAEVTLEADWFHPRNSVHKVIPTKLIYNGTDASSYNLLG